MSTFSFFAELNPVSGRDWSLGFEGISPGWALLVLVALVAGNVWAYLKLTPAMATWRRYTLLVLRVLITAVFLVLLVKPILNLTLNEPIRQGLLVLVDASQSMTLADKRDRPDDLKRAAIAAGLMNPGVGLKQELPAGAGAQLGSITRWDLFQRMAVNETLNLWPRLANAADLIFYQFGRDAVAAGTPATDPAGHVTAADAGNFFKALHPDKPMTAIGDSLRQVLREGHGRPLGGVLLITDGGNNTGSAPLEAARVAKDLNIPLFIYGLGVTTPPDLIVREVNAPRLAFAKERIEVRAKIHAQGLGDHTVSAVLKAGGEQVDEQKINLNADGDYEVVFHFEPEQPGEMRLEVSVPVLPGEISADNNTGTTSLRVTDSKFQVLLVEQEPRWDFRFLLAYLQRDRRLEVKCVMIDGEPGLSQTPNSPFLPRLPDDRETYFHSQVLILGDVDPQDLGADRMDLIQEWVEAGGGIIFLAGPRFNPSAYVGTPLEALLPVVPDTSSSREWSLQRAPEPFKLQLTSEGETSPYLQMSNDPEENRKIWDDFSGVRWTAPAARAKPGAKVLLVDPRPDHANRYGPPPVFAMQAYGAGTCVYFGTDETYRWRSHVGEKYYSILWGQIMQSLSLQLLQGASPLTQLKTDRATYAPGDKVVISGNLYTTGYNRLVAPSVEGTLSIKSTDASGKTKTQEEPLTLTPISGESGYRAEFVARQEGECTFTTARDPDAALTFEVIEPHLEQMQTALNERLLKAMAETAGGKFIREEDLDQLPQQLLEKSATVASFTKLDLYYSNGWLALLLLLFFSEWLLRRLSQLK